MKKLPVEQITVDATSGKEVGRKTVDFGILPPHPNACQVCAVNPAHDEHEPHNAQSLYYQYAFKGVHGRWPTWKDAVAHCPEEIREAWERELRNRGAWTE